MRAVDKTSLNPRRTAAREPSISKALNLAHTAIAALMGILGFDLAVTTSTVDFATFGVLTVAVMSASVQGDYPWAVTLDVGNRFRRLLDDCQQFDASRTVDHDAVETASRLFLQCRALSALAARLRFAIAECFAWTRRCLFEHDRAYRGTIADT